MRIFFESVARTVFPWFYPTPKVGEVWTMFATNCWDVTITKVDKRMVVITYHGINQVMDLNVFKSTHKKVINEVRSSN